MNLLCPHCQKMLTVPEQYAGQPMKCPLCTNTFTVPALPQAPVTSVASANWTAPPPPASSPSPPPAPAPTDFYSVAAEPPTAPAPRREERVNFSPAPEPTRPPFADKTPPAPAPPAPPPPAGYHRTSTLWVSPRVVPWIAPVCILLFFLLLFFPWVGMHPGGTQVYSQTGWGTAFGSYWSNPVWERVAAAGRDRKAAATAAEPITPGASAPMLIYVLVLLVLALPAAVLFVLLVAAPATLPPAVQRYKPWRTTILGGLVLFLTLLLVLQLLWGFSLENAVLARAEEHVASEREQAKTPEEVERVELRRAQFLSQFNVRPTSWLRLAAFLHLVALAGVGLDLWLQRRGARPLPRVDFLW
jgi:hypothetical protein